MWVRKTLLIVVILNVPIILVVCAPPSTSTGSYSKMHTLQFGLWTLHGTPYSQGISALALVKPAVVCARQDKRGWKWQRCEQHSRIKTYLQSPALLNIWAGMAPWTLQSASEHSWIWHTMQRLSRFRTVRDALDHNICNKMETALPTLDILSKSIIDKTYYFSCFACLQTFLNQTRWERDQLDQHHIKTDNERENSCRPGLSG